MEKTGVCDSCPLKNCTHVGPTGSPNPDVVLIGGFPVSYDVQKGVGFSSKNGDMLRRLVTNIVYKEFPKNRKPNVAYMYAIQCAPPFNESTKKYATNADIVASCSQHVMRFLDTKKPKAIVALGTDAVKSLGFKDTIRHMRGGLYSIKLSDGTAVPVVPTYHVVEVSKSPGLFPTLMTDIRKALRMVSGGMPDGKLRVRVFKSADEIVSALDKIGGFAEKQHTETGKPLALAMDTETTSLTPSNPEDRVIAISLAFRDMEGIAFPFEHRENPFSPEGFVAVKDAVSRLLGSEHVMLVECNGKFDTQWLMYRYKLHIHQCAYDAQLAEHVLDEDKKGEYGLKDITKDRFPALGRYEQELQQHLADKERQFLEEVKAAEEAFKTATQDAMLSWWVELDTAERERFLGRWIVKQYITLADSQGLHEVKRRKLKGGLVIPKKYQAAVGKMLARVPVDEVPGLALPERQHAREPRKVTFEDIDIDVLLNYAAIDALTTRMIVKDQLPQFSEDWKRIEHTQRFEKKRIVTRPIMHAFNTITMPLSHCLAHMEYHGVRLDRERAQSYAEVIRGKIAEAEDILFTEVGRKFNLSSSAPDLVRILFEEMRLPVLKRTDAGAPSTDAETIKELSDKHNLPFLDHLLAHRKLDKCLNTYILNWLKMSSADGKIHCNFNQIGTATYRLSSSNPNLQNVPFSLKEANLNLKSLFIPDSDDFEIYDLDISNAEMRILTAYSRDASLIDAFNTGKDLHCLTAAGISSYTYEDLKAHKEDKNTDQYRKRQLAKKVNFGTIYMMSPDRLQQQLWSEMRIEESLEACQGYLDGFFKAYPGVAEYIEYTKRFVETYHYAYTFTGRRRRFPMAAYSRGQASRMARQAVNARIQTTSSDLVSCNIVDVHNALLKLGGRVILTVHDSLPFQAPKGITGLKAKLKELVTENTAKRFPWLPVEWKFDVGRGPNYGDTHGDVE